MSRERLESLYKDLMSFIGKTITEVDLLIVNQQIFDIKDCDRQLVDGGMQIRFADGSVLSYGWSQKYLLQRLEFSNLRKMIDVPSKELPTGDDYFWKRVVGSSIDHIEVEWNWFQDIEGQVFYIPYYLEVFLDTGMHFLVAAVDFQRKNKNIGNFEFDAEEWIGVFFDAQEIEAIKRLPIANRAPET